jgi:hypothetical protein
VVLGHREPGQLCGQLTSAREGCSVLSFHERGSGEVEEDRDREGELGTFSAVLVG